MTFICFLSVYLRHDQIDAYIEEQSLVYDDGFTYCAVCQYSSRSKQSHRLDVRRHIESIHITTDPFPCDQCGKQVKTRLQLQRQARELVLSQQSPACSVRD